MELLQPFLLRRCTSDIEAECPLAPYSYMKILCPESQLQKEEAHNIFTKYKTFLERLFHNGEREQSLNFTDDDNTKVSSTSKLLSIFLQLLKIADHPYLQDVRRICQRNGEPTNDILLSSGKMAVLDRLLLNLKAKGHRVLIVSQFPKMIDILDDYLCLTRDSS